MSVTPLKGKGLSVRPLRGDAWLSLAVPRSWLPLEAPALGVHVAAERSRRPLGLRQGAVPLGASDPAALAQILLLLEAPQTGRAALVQGRRTSPHLPCFISMHLVRRAAGGAVVKENLANRLQVQLLYKEATLFQK